MNELGKCLILVIEDDETIGLVCQLALAEEGFLVDMALNGRVAQILLSQKDYDLILMDVKMPVMSGRDIYDYISENHPELVPRVVMTSGDLIGGDTKAFVAESGRPFLPKPFTIDELKAIVRETLGQL
jgi:DNA-binding response OmpR family regulator